MNFKFFIKKAQKVDEIINKLEDMNKKFIPSSNK